MGARPVIPNFWHHPGIHGYDLGAKHPLKQTRLYRLHALLDRIADVDWRFSQLADDDDICRVHTDAYWAEVCAIDACLRRGETTGLTARRQAIDLKGDTPAFAGMELACRAYVGATADAARAVVSGARVAFAMGGGLHHAMPGAARGFCILNDPAIAVSVLADRFDRVMYIDLDVHHGDGVEAIFRNDRRVLTYSIHEDPATLWPRTGHAQDVGPVGTCVNMPIPAGATGADWGRAFRETFSPVVDWFQPNALVVQCGADPHLLDHLAHLRSDIPAYAQVLKQIAALRIPAVVVGGGGYHMAVTPVTWATAVLTLSGHAIPDTLPGDLAEAWEWPDWVGPVIHGDALRAEISRRIESFRAEVLPEVRRRASAPV